MHRVIVAALVSLVACSTPAPITGFRDPARQIYSAAVFDPARIAGTWMQVADFAASPGCTLGAVRFAPVGADMRIDGELCLGGMLTPVAGPLVPAGPGRFGLAGVPDVLWVLWADTDLRTLVIGTPSGRFGLILDRDTDIARDRLTAARDVLAWNGYDLTRLRLRR